LGEQGRIATYFAVQADKAGILEVELRGRWVLSALSDIEREFGGFTLKGQRSVAIDGRALEDLDTAGAWCLHALVARLKSGGAGVTLRDFHERNRLLFERIAALPFAPPPATKRAGAFAALVGGLGRQADGIRRDVAAGLVFLGEFLTVLLRRLKRPHHFRLRSLVFHVNEAGVKAVPIIALMGFSLAFVTAYQGAYQLQRFDAVIFTIDLVSLSMLRELGVLLVSIMLAGRSSSAFAAQLGTMKLNEEIDALQTMGLSPFEVLVLPRLLALLIALPLLTLVADLTGILGGYAYMSLFMNYSWLQYMARLQEASDIKHLYVGLSKAPFFALLIGIVGCMQGLRAGASSEEVGRRTITAVVQSIFLVVVFDALFSVIFTKRGV
jgi:phospholipid/cholesterol/gamma-HCH transport system permease protein